MDAPSRPSASLFQVYLRLKPPVTSEVPIAVTTPLYPELPPERYITVEEPNTTEDHGLPTHITVTPPTDSKRRAVEKFAFTKVFEEPATQLDIFTGTGIGHLIEGLLGAEGRNGRDALVATLGVTGSGKSHTILGSPSQRGLTQLALDVLFRSLGDHLLHPFTALSLFSTLAAADASEAHLVPAALFLNGQHGEVATERMTSRAQTPMTVGNIVSQNSPFGLYPAALGLSTGAATLRTEQHTPHPPLLPHARVTRSTMKLRHGPFKDGGLTSIYRPPHALRRLSALPQLPDISNIAVNLDRTADYAVLVSMYEVYNDRIFDLLAGQQSFPAAQLPQRDARRRPLIFKSTEHSPDRKVVAGLRKVICGNLDEALLVLEAGLVERRVAGTGSNSVSSRSHGFFCVEVKKRLRRPGSPWTQSTLTIVDLAGSERARNAKTAGATLAEAGKINESLMYLGQCLQMQSDTNEKHKPAAVPFRQCKLTELLFSNSFPVGSATTHHTSPHRNPQRAIMIVTADPLGDFNATSQILRYSALAREVTVPRVPSIASTILSGTATKNHFASGRTTPTSISTEELVFAAQEIARLAQEVEEANIRVAEEQNRRHEAELAWRAAQESCDVMEQEIREECWIEMEKRIEEERRRWKGAWNEEADRNDEHLDKKLEILTRSIQIYEDPEPSSSLTQRMKSLEEENDDLRRKLDQMERELHGRSPTKNKKPKGIQRLANEKSQEEPDLDSILPGLSSMALHEESTNLPKAKTPGKKQRKLTTRKWDLGSDTPSP